MAPDTMTFPCPACGIRLTVPVRLAGISGPCPSCRAQIQSPVSSPSIPTATPEPPQAAPPREEETRPSIAPVHGATAGPAAVRRPEPRPLPKRTVPEEATANEPAAATHIGNMWNAKPAPLAPQPEAGPRWPRFLLVTLFVAAAGAFAYFVLSSIHR